jgi:SAM-dependent methyltransferase
MTACARVHMLGLCASTRRISTGVQAHITGYRRIGGSSEGAVIDVTAPHSFNENRSRKLSNTESSITTPDRHWRRCYDAPMRPRDAIDMLADSGVEALGPTIWADLGCGDGTFTLALAELLASGSTIHAMDLVASALRRIPSAHRGVRITTHRGDFTKQPWPFAGLDGILMANSLHYVENQESFIRTCEQRMKSPRRFLIVEYDTSHAGRWLPYPVSQARLTDLFERAGYFSIKVLRSRASIYRRAPLYAAAIGLS